MKKAIYLIMVGMFAFGLNAYAGSGKFSPFKGDKNVIENPDKDPKGKSAKGKSSSTSTKAKGTSPSSGCGDKPATKPCGGDKKDSKADCSGKSDVKTSGSKASDGCSGTNNAATSKSNCPKTRCL